MALCGVYGPPDLFVTFICNTKWREIADALRYKPGQLSCVRSDLIVPVFHMNVDEFVHDIRDCRTFGAVRAVEFQKNGLPHIQFLVWLADAHPEFSASMIEQLGDDSGSGNNGAGTLDQTRAHPAPNKRVAKWLSTKEQAGESEGMGVEVRPLVLRTG